MRKGRQRTRRKPFRLKPRLACKAVVGISVSWDSRMRTRHFRVLNFFQTTSSFRHTQIDQDFWLCQIMFFQWQFMSCASDKWSNSIYAQSKLCSKSQEITRNGVIWSSTMRFTFRTLFEWNLALSLLVGSHHCYFLQSWCYQTVLPPCHGNKLLPN